MTEQIYRVVEGIDYVDGKRVPENRLVTLSDEAARFDIEQGRIEGEPVTAPPVVETPETPETPDAAGATSVEPDPRAGRRRVAD